MYALAFSDGRLYAGGDYNAARGASAADVAWWNGAQWHPFGQHDLDWYEPGLNHPDVRALAVSGDFVFVGGDFWRLSLQGDGASGPRVNGIVAWDRVDDQWYILGQDIPGVTTNTGNSGEVYALAIVGGDVYVGGEFERAGAANSIARWNSAANEWYALGDIVRVRQWVTDYAAIQITEESPEMTVLPSGQ